MQKKKILIVSSAFYPGISARSFRTTELVKGFAKLGHDVTLITFKNDEYHLPFEEEHGVKIKHLGNRSFPDINANSKSTLIKYFKRIVKRGLLQLFEYPDIEIRSLVKKALKTERGYDLLISIAVPHPVHWGVAAAWDANNRIAKTWVADCGDPYMGAIWDSFKKMFYFSILEKGFGRKADYITVPNIAMKENYYSEFHHKMVEIPQGFNFDEISLQQFKPNSLPTFAFAGTFMRIGRNPDQLVKALIKSQRDFRFVVYTKDASILNPYLDVLGEKLIIKGLIPRQQLLNELSAMDFLVNIGYDPVHQLPSKLIDYYMVGRPIYSYNIDSFDETVMLEFLDADYKNQLICKDIDKYRIENVCGTFLELCN